MREYFNIISRSWIAIFGAVVTTVSALLFLVLFGIDTVSHHSGAYTGIVSFVLVPAVFVGGLVIMPLGVVLRRRADRKLAAAGQALPLAPIIDFNQPRTLRIVAAVGGLTVVNFAIMGAAAYKSLEVMDSTEFCGTACHSVMAPEYTAYQRSPHSRVPCTECHIGSGAGWFVKSKLSGSWQLVSVALNLYPRPIPTPVHNLRPARDTCEECHWPTKFVGDRLKVLNRFQDDETNTLKKSVLLMKIGGVRNGKGAGIHWHVDPANQVRYQSDEKRRKIYDVEVKNGAGETKLFASDEKPAADEKIEWRTMDCIDCHNRPTHQYRRPERELDDAFTAGTLDAELPFLRREGLRLLTEKYASQEAARAGLREGLAEFYRTNYAEVAKEKAAQIEKAGATLFDLYRVNVWPEMNIQWGTYGSNLEHENGCFRCHNNEHRTADDKKIGKKCQTCHEVLAEQEEEPEVLETLYP